MELILHGEIKAVQGKNAVAWPTCCRPILAGGLSIIDLMLAGFALRTRWLWLQRTDAERSWAQLQIDVEPEVRAFFSASVTVQVGNGESTLFWLHAWIQGRSFAFYKAGYLVKKNPPGIHPYSENSKHLSAPI